jgi:hypothetical protein
MLLATQTLRSKISLTHWGSLEFNMHPHSKGDAFAFHCSTHRFTSIFQILSIFTNIPPPVTLRILSFCFSMSAEVPLPVIIPSNMALYEVFFFFFFGVTTSETDFTSASLHPSSFTWEISSKIVGWIKFGDATSTGTETATGFSTTTACLLLVF